MDPAIKQSLSPYSTFTNNPLCFSDPIGYDTLRVTGKNNSYLSISYGNGTKVHEFNLADYGIKKDIGKNSFDLGVEYPDVLGLDLQVSGQFTLLSAQYGVNLVWHTRGEENAFVPEVHAYQGGGVALGKSSFEQDLSGSASVSFFWGWAKEVDKTGKTVPAKSSWVANGYNWTGDFWTASISVGEGYQLSGSKYTSLQPGTKAQVGSPYWSGYSIGFGVGGSATGGAQKQKLLSMH
jgi:hypothetical protein